MVARDHLAQGVGDELRGTAAFHQHAEARQHRLDIRVAEAAQVPGDRRALPIPDRRVRLPDQVFDDAGGIELARTGKGKEPPQVRGGELPEILGVVGNTLGRIVPDRRHDNIYTGYAVWAV